jgi:hypothetical protein
VTARPARPSRRIAAGTGLAWALAVAIALVAACEPAATPSLGPVTTASLLPPASGSPNGSPGAPASPLTGVLTDIDATGLSEVTGFTVRTNDGTEVRFRIGVLENGAEFPPGHLAEHLATSSPVRVYFRAEGADLVVYRLEDAG